jgi:hypothetical protein
MEMRVGFYSDLRYAVAAMKADKMHLAAAPLGPRQRKALEGRVEFQKARVARLRKELRDARKELKDTAEKKCGTCGRWAQGRVAVLGDCTAEGEGTVRDHACKIGLWIPKREEKSFGSEDLAQAMMRDNAGA